MLTWDSIFIKDLNSDEGLKFHSKIHLRIKLPIMLDAGKYLVFSTEGNKLALMDPYDSDADIIEMD